MTAVETDDRRRNLSVIANDRPDPAEEQYVLRVRNLTKRFQRRDGAVVNAIDNISLDVRRGEFLVLLGASGCGKTTLLRCIAGLEDPDAGEIEIHGRPQFSSEDGIAIPPEGRGLSMIFQSYALWPHMTVSQNVAYPLQARGVNRREIPDRVREALEFVGIADLGRQYPGQLSGGQQQRVSLARAVVSRDPLLLFDEPFSNIDARVRAQVRAELVLMQRALRFAAVFVTHDQIEAMEMADTIAVLNGGKVEQRGAPREIYEEPKTPYVANFIGGTNACVGVVVRSTADRCTVRTNFGELEGICRDQSLAAGDSAIVIVRPQSCRVSSIEPRSVNRISGVLKTSLYSGSHTEYLVGLGQTTLRARLIKEPLNPGALCWVSFDTDNVRVLRADSQSRVGPKLARPAD